MDRSLEVELGGRLEVSDKEAERRFFDELDFKSEDALVDFRILVGILKREGKQLEVGGTGHRAGRMGQSWAHSCGCDFREMGRWTRTFGFTIEKKNLWIYSIRLKQRHKTK